MSKRRLKCRIHKARALEIKALWDWKYSNVGMRCNKPKHKEPSKREVNFLLRVLTETMSGESCLRDALNKVIGVQFNKPIRLSGKWARG